MIAGQDRRPAASKDRILAIPEALRSACVPMIARVLAVDCLTDEQQRELDEFYWQTNTSVVELQEHFGIPRGRVHQFVRPLPAEAECPNCQGELAFKSRATRTENRKVCPSCGHKQSAYCEGRGYSVVCSCSYCRDCQEMAEADRQRQIQEARQRELDEWSEQKCTGEYAEWAVGQLDRRTRLVYRAILEQLDSEGEFSWGEVENAAGVVSRRTYVERLLSIGLAHPRPDGGLTFNGCLEPDEIVTETVRNISNSLRFEIFQRDEHICQYCGRRPPEVELEIDHLIPVAKNGTDEPENLVTSCKECNRGKSARLIRSFTGHSQEEWRTRLREQRNSELESRRGQLAAVMDHWKARRGFLSAYDSDGIHRLIERYDADSIMRALDIAIEKQPSNYVKYVSGILRNWSRSGAAA